MGCGGTGRKRGEGALIGEEKGEGASKRGAGGGAGTDIKTWRRIKEEPEVEETPRAMQNRR